MPTGRNVVVVDDQGVSFSLWSPSAWSRLATAAHAG